MNCIDRGAIICVVSICCETCGLDCSVDESCGPADLCTVLSFEVAIG